MRYVWLICLGVELWCSQPAPDSFVREAFAASKWSCVSHGKTKILFFVAVPTAASSSAQLPSTNWKSRHGKGPDICQPLIWQLTNHSGVAELVIQGRTDFSALLRDEIKRGLSPDRIMNLKYGHFDWALTPGDRVGFSPSVHCVFQYGHPYGEGLLINLANSVIHLMLLSFPLKLNWLKHTAKRLSLHWYRASFSSAEQHWNEYWKNK